MLWCTVAARRRGWREDGGWADGAPTTPMPDWPRRLRAETGAVRCVTLVGMIAATVRRSFGPGWPAERGFARLAGTWLGGLVGLYAIYALIAFSRLEPQIPDAHRAIMVLGPTTMAAALLVSAATFAASATRFDLLTARDPMHRRVYWAQLALFGVGSYLLVAVGAPLVRSMLPGAGDLPADSLLPSARASDLRLLFPAPFGVFAVLSGIVGALVGRITSRSVRKHSGAVPWLACFGLVGAFAASFLATSTLIVQGGFPSAWIIIGPLTVPLIAVAALARRDDLGPRSLFRTAEETVESDPLDPDTVDEILSRVIDSTRTKGGRQTATTTPAEDRVAHLTGSIRAVAGTRARMSPAQVSGIVEHLVTRGGEPTQAVPKMRFRTRVAMGELCAVWVSLAAGYLVVGSMGGLMPSVSAAVIAGIVGSVVALPFFRDPPRAYGT